jgi:hypothetical protein
MGQETFLKIHQVNWVRQEDARGGASGPIATDTVKRTGIWCRVRELPGRQSADLGQESIEYNHEVSFMGCYDPRADERDYFVWRDAEDNVRHLHVEGKVNPYGRDRYITYFCMYTPPVDSN